MSEQSLADMQYLIQEGRRLEQERIIKSMQERYDEILEVEGIVVGQERLDLLIELMEEIKGEQK